MAFYVELPADEWGNTAYTQGVIEGEIVGEGRDAEMVFKEPKEMAEKWPSGNYCRIYGGWMEVDGPVRDLSWGQRKELFAKLGVSHLRQPK